MKLDRKIKDIVLLQGVFESKFFDLLKKKKYKTIFVLEGRPRLKAAKDSSKELLKRKMTPTLISDNMAGLLFYKRLVKEVWVANYLKDKNGAICDVGSLAYGVLAKRHKVPLYLYASKEKVDFIGKQKDITHFNGIKVAPQNIKGYVPLVEWLPGKYITKAQN